MQMLVVTLVPMKVVGAQKEKKEEEREHKIIVRKTCTDELTEQGHSSMALFTIGNLT